MAYILYFIITIGVLVLVHEFGHFIAAKLSGMKVDTFSVGFPPRAFGKKIGDTDYCVSWVPIGGYVKIAGMIDESFDTDFVNKPPQPNEFRAKPMYQRIIVVCAGVIMNFILAFAIFYGINLAQGKLFHATTTIGVVQPNSIAQKVGFENGDKLLTVNGKGVRNWEQIQSDFYINDVSNPLAVKVDRGGEVVNLTVPKGVVRPDKDFGLYPNHTHVVIDSIIAGKPAAAAGIRSGDTVVSVDGRPVVTDLQLIGLVKARKGELTQFGVKRGSGEKTISVTPDSEGKIGIGITLTYTGPIEKVNYNVLSAVPASIDQTVGAAGLLIRSIYQMITGEVSFTKNIGGPIRIAQLATQEAELGLVSFLGFMALLSITLGVLNIIPFPALDGGHLAFLVYESIFRREVPVKVKLVAQQIGFAVLLLFMAFVVYNDIVHF